MKVVRRGSFRSRIGLRRLYGLESNTAREPRERRALIENEKRELFADRQG